MATPDFTVIQVGTDTSGRPIFMTRYAWAVWKAVLADPEVAPFAHLITIVQGAFMTRVSGGGASASAGYHDLAGCWDFRTWNLTTSQILALIRALRRAGVAVWRRGPSSYMGGMDPHGHTVFGTDRPLAGGAAVQWQQYLRNESGLASGGRDYEWRPSPLVTTPPAGLFKEEFMSDAAERKLDALTTDVAQLGRELTRFRTAEAERDRNENERFRAQKRELVSLLGGIVDGLTEVADAKDLEAVKRRTGEIKQLVLKHLAEDPDIDGAENPAPEEES